MEVKEGRGGNERREGRARVRGGKREGMREEKERQREGRMKRERQDRKKGGREEGWVGGFEVDIA